MQKVTKIVSGGQTGADSGALNAAIKLGIKCGGFCPKGRRRESGVVPEKYGLVETPSSGYAERTRLNVITSAATLALTIGKITPGTNHTINYAIENDKPVLHLDLSNPIELNAETLRKWLARMSDEVVLNVAGSRESKAPGICKATELLLIKALGTPNE